MSGHEEGDCLFYLFGSVFIFLS